MRTRTPPCPAPHLASLRRPALPLGALALACALANGCGKGGSGPTPPPAPDASVAPEDGGPPPPRDAGPPGCPSGQHPCGTGCIDDLPNEPARGCRLGCGEPCPAPAHAAATCTAVGRCSFECVPPAVAGLDGACACEPMTCADLGASCGTPDDGCGGVLECGGCPSGATCELGTCSCPLDGGEPNESSAAAHALSPFTDAPDTAMTFSTYAIHGGTDEDWFRFVVTDGTDGGNPQVRVDLDMIPSGSDYDLAAWYVCDAGTDASACTAGSPDATLGAGCLSESRGITPETVALATDCEHFGLDDSGTVYVRVRAPAFGGRCEAYRLDVSVR